MLRAYSPPTTQAVLSAYCLLCTLHLLFRCTHLLLCCSQHLLLRLNFPPPHRRTSPTAQIVLSSPHLYCTGFPRYLLRRLHSPPSTQAVCILHLLRKLYSLPTAHAELPISCTCILYSIHILHTPYFPVFADYTGCTRHPPLRLYSPPISQVLLSTNYLRCTRHLLHSLYSPPTTKPVLSTTRTSSTIHLLLRLNLNSPHPVQLYCPAFTRCTNCTFRSSATALAVIATYCSDCTLHLLHGLCSPPTAQAVVSTHCTG
jgi:hypothetical protein